MRGSPAVRRVAHIKSTKSKLSLVIRSVNLPPLSSEYYLGTVPFQADPEASTLHAELIDASRDIREPFIIDIKDLPFSTPEHVASALDSKIQLEMKRIYEDLTSASKKRIGMPKIKVGYDVDEKRFWFAISEKQGFRLQLANYGERILLRKLGFSARTQEQGPLAVLPGKREDAESLWTIGDGGEYGGRSLREQRVRSDEGFGSLRKSFERKFRDWRGKGKQPTGKGKGKGPDNEDEEPDDEDGELVIHSENLLLAEYLFSLVFLSMFRAKGPTMKIAANASVNDDSADDFAKKLDSVCNFNIGVTESNGPGSLKKVMKEVVKKARTESVMV